MFSELEYTHPKLGGVKVGSRLSFSLKTPSKINNFISPDGMLEGRITKNKIRK
jgi:hypothetical protein